MKLTPGGVILMFAMQELNFVVDVWETHKSFLPV